MKTSQWIICLVVGILMFLITFYIGKTTILPALFVGIIGFIGEVFISIRANKKNKKKVK